VIDRTVVNREEAEEISDGPHSIEMSFQIPSHAEFIAPAVDKVVRSIRKARCIPGKEGDVGGALFEAIANAVTHGNHQDPKKPVRIRCRYDPKKCISIVVSDQGEGFDPAKLPDATSERRRGLLLMKALMDEVHLENGGTEVHMVKKCDGPVQTMFKDYAARMARYVRSWTRGREKH